MQGAILRQMAKIRLGAVIGSDTSGHDKACAAGSGIDLQDCFGKERVSIHVTDAGERIASPFGAIDVHKDADASAILRVVMNS